MKKESESEFELNLTSI